MTNSLAQRRLGAEAVGQVIPWPTRPQVELDRLLRKVHARAKLLMGSTTRSDPAARADAAAKFRRGEAVRWVCASQRMVADSAVWSAFAHARQLAPQAVAPELMRRRLEELELELTLLEVLGESKLVRTMAKRLYSVQGPKRVPLGSSVVEFATNVLSMTEPQPEPRTVPAQGKHGPSVVRAMQTMASACGLRVAVKVSADLTADAAVGDRTVFVADRSFGERQTLRLAAHEVLGHLVSQSNGRLQRGALWLVGTAGSFASQEGVCLFIEELMGVLDLSRLRTLAARTIATDALHQGAGFHETLRLLVQDHGMLVDAAVVTTERAFRGGGLARDGVYLPSWLRIREAVRSGEVGLHELQVGKVALDDVPTLRSLVASGHVRPGAYGPNRALSRFATGAGTSFSTLPPSLATSLTNVDAT